MNVIRYSLILTACFVFPTVGHAGVISIENIIDSNMTGTTGSVAIGSLSESGVVSFVTPESIGVASTSGFQIVDSELGQTYTLGFGKGTYFSPNADNLTYMRIDSTGNRHLYRSQLAGGVYQPPQLLQSDPRTALGYTYQEINGINNDGTVVGSSLINPGGSTTLGIYSVNSSQLDTIIDPRTHGTIDVSAFDPDINDSGQISFTGRFNEGGSENIGVFRRETDGSLTRLADKSNGFESFRETSINDNGNTVFLADPVAVGGDDASVLFSDGNSITQIASAADAEFARIDTEFMRPVINNHDHVAFLAFDSMTDRESIYFYDGLSTQKIASVGDSYFGGVFASLGSLRINDANQVGFSYRLDDGTNGIGLISLEAASTPVPEPGSMALLALCGLGGFGYRRRKRMHDEAVR